MNVPEAGQGQDVTIRVIRSEDEWDDVRSDWDALHRATPDASPFLRFAWLRGWWRAYGPRYGTGGLRILTCWHGADLVGAVPLYVRVEHGPLHVRCLRFVSTGEAEEEETCPDYLDLLSQPGFEPACARAAWEGIARLDWDRLELDDVPAGSLLLRLPRPLRRVKSYPRGVCPVADLNGGFESYLARLSPNSRQQARRLLREGERAGVRFELAGVDGTTETFDEMVRLHQQRWVADGQPGVFGSERFTDFHRRLVREWQPREDAVLARMSFEGVPIAVLYGFVSHRRFAFYQSGVDLAADNRLRSPGTLAHLLLMRTLAARGVLAYDFLRGSASYKDRLATRESHLSGLRTWRPTPRGLAWWPIRLAVKIGGRGRRATSEGRR
ncbi:MAG: GNAT family N-acetyltransferase [Acidobacteriota bacterium]